MRQVSLIAGLVAVVLIAAVAAWYFSSSSPQVTINAVNDGAVLNSDTDPLDHNPVNKPALPTPDPRPDRPDPTDPQPADQPGEDEWLLRGRIELAPELAKFVARPLDWVSEAQIYYLADGHGPDDAAEFYTELDEHLGFSELVHESEFNLENGAALPPAKWQVLYSNGNETPPSLGDLDDDHPLSTLMGLVKPRITGRVVDFGTITISLDLFYYRSVVLTGRIVHTSGRPLAYSGPHILCGTYEQDDVWGWTIDGQFMTAGDGTFTAITWLDQAEDLAKLGKYEWTLLDENGVEFMQTGETAGRVPKPQWTGRLANFGDITVPGALVEIVLKCDFKPILKADGKLDLNSWGEYEGDQVVVDFEGSSSYASVAAFPQPFTTVTVLPEGRYIWSAWATSSGFYPDLNGVLLARAGQVHRLEIELKALLSIPLVITPEPAPRACAVDWQINRGETDVGSGNFYFEAGSRVPVVEGCETTVWVRAGGFTSAEAVALPGMDKLEITLEKFDQPVATVIVVVPAYPKALVGNLPSASLVVRAGEATQGVQNPAWGAAPVEQTFTFTSSGRMTAVLSGGINWGYAKGILSGPVEVELILGQTVRIELPPISDPPWSRPVTNVTVRATTSGCPMNLTSYVRYKDQAEPVNESLTNAGNLPVRGVAVAITDGREDFPVQFTTSEDQTATLTIELPHTIEVRLLRAGKPVEQFHVVARRNDIAKPDLGVTCEANAIDGVAKLWIPRGRVSLDVRINGSTVANHEAEVTPGQVVQVEAGSSKLQLTLELPDETYDPYAHHSDAPELWALEYSMEEGGWGPYTEFSVSIDMILDAGKYRVVPWNGGDAIEFELSEDKTILLPEIAAPKFGSVVLKFDVAQLGTAYADAEFYYQLIDKLDPKADWVDANWMATTLVPDGFRIDGLPLNIDIAIWGSAWVDGDEEYTLLLKPMKLRITEEGKLIDVVLKRGVQLDEEWLNLNARWLTSIEGLTRDIGEHALPGRQEIAVYGNESEILFREWVTIPETSAEPFKIPDNLRRELEARELIEPREEE